MAVIPRGLMPYRTREGREEPFYVPSFRLEIGRDPGQLQPVWDVRQVTYKDAFNQIDSFEAVLGNTAWYQRDIRYTGRLPTAQSGSAGRQGGGASSPAHPSLPVILPGVYARLWLGYESRMGLFPLLTGRVTSVTPAFSDGPATVAVRALSSLEALREKKKDFIWRPGGGRSEITDTEIAKRIAADPENNIELVPLPDLQEAGQPTVTQNDTDISFLISRAKLRGYVVVFREKLPSPTGAVATRVTAFGATKKVMFFGPSDLLRRQQLIRLGERDQPFELAWGKSLLEFKPTINVSTNIWSSVTLAFWNRRNRNRPVKSYTLEDLWTKEGINADLAPYLQPLIRQKALGQNEISNVPVHTEDQAQELARNSLRENFLGLVTADGSTVGMPELRAGGRVLVTGVGVPFDGGWFITSTTHTIDDSGYRTQFSARREQLRGGAV